MLLDATESAALGALLPGAVTWRPIVSSWLEGEFLADVPVSGGSVTWSTSREVPGSVDLRVPRITYGGAQVVDWRPLTDDAPLAARGQILHVSVEVRPISGEGSWQVRLGTFIITRSDTDEDSVRVSGVSMLERVVRSRLTSPVAPRSGGTLASEFRRLLPAELGLSVSGSLTDRACPAMSWGESRIDALREIADAWPCRMRENVYGDVELLPPLSGPPVPADTLTDGDGGTVVGAYGSDTSDGVANEIVARGQERDEAGRPTVQAIARQTSGPYSVSRFGAVTEFFSSPLLESVTAAAAAAQTILARKVSPARTVPVAMAPDPRWWLDDPVAVVTGAPGPARLAVAHGAYIYPTTAMYPGASTPPGGDYEPQVLHPSAVATVTRLGWVSGITVPLTVGDGDGRLDVEVSA